MKLALIILTVIIGAIPYVTQASIAVDPTTGNSLDASVVVSDNGSFRYYLYYEEVSGDWCSYTDSMVDGVTTLGDIYDEHFSGSGNCAATTKETGGEWVIGWYNGSIIAETAVFTLEAPPEPGPSGVIGTVLPRVGTTTCNGTTTTSVCVYEYVPSVGDFLGEAILYMFGLALFASGIVVWRQLTKPLL